MNGAVVDGILQGKAVAAHVRETVGAEVRRLRAENVELTLAVVRVGDDPASEIYVRHKIRACAEVGIQSRALVMPAATTEAELLAQVAALNVDDSIDGILVQLPLPAGIDEDHVLEAVHPDKDVDGFHPLNVGHLVARGRALLQPCTPAGVMVLLEAAGIATRGREAVVVGRSVIVGRPMAQLLLRADATVTVCHRHTADLVAHVARADILVVAAGVPGLVPGSAIKPGATVIDVGMNRLDDGRICGDVDFEAARPRARLITPVPGGVGPMTVAMLLWNTVLAGRARRGLGVGTMRSPLRN